MFKTLKNEKGLTLIELIAVLVILGIIAAIAIPTIGNTISTQRQRAADAEWSAIMSAARFYIAENDTETAFSMTDLFTGNYITENVVLEEDTDGTVISATDDLFTNVNGNPVIDETIPADGDVYIDGFMVYDGA
jgi:type IV pilus assembly protein PilA